MAKGPTVSELKRQAKAARIRGYSRMRKAELLAALGSVGITSEQEYLGGKVRLLGGDCTVALHALEDASIDSCVCDPPYHLTSIVKRFGGKNAAPAKIGKSGAYARASAGFMGKQWDGGDIAFRPDVWAEVYRVLKPWGYLLAFSGTRTYHRMACAIEQAGFEVRDQIWWAYGSGFPKSHDVSKGIDRRAGAERQVIGVRRYADGTEGHWGESDKYAQDEHTKSLVAGTPKLETAPATDAAKEWQGWGTALKPSYEPLCVAQKPLDYGQNIAIIGSHVATLWSRLWLMLSAKDAAKLSALSPSASGVDPSAFAQWSADAVSSTRAALSAQMGTSQFASALISSLSTVSSWSATWAAALAPENTSIIETELSTTIGWRTLRFLLSKITVESIIQAHKTGQWSIADASPAESSFDAIARRLSSTLALSALAPAIAKEADNSLAVGAKPNWSPICLARKPLVGTVAENVLQYGTGAINIDGCRVEADTAEMEGRSGVAEQGNAILGKGIRNPTDDVWEPSKLCRWPANICHDGSDDVLAAFPEAPGQQQTIDPSAPSPKTSNVYGAMKREGEASANRRYAEEGATNFAALPGARRNDSGSAARFFYTAKADAEDRLGSKHPTVKPLDLMQWLVRLVTPKGGVVLDCFAGTGTTGEAAWREGMRAVLIEREAEYQADIARRMELADNPTKRTAVAVTKNNLVAPESLPLFGGAEA